MSSEVKINFSRLTIFKNYLTNPEGRKTTFSKCLSTESGNPKIIVILTGNQKVYSQNV